MGKRSGLAPIPTAVAVLTVLPLGILAGLLLAQIQPPGAEATAAPLIADATEVAYDDRRGVLARPTWQPGPALHAPAWAGVVGWVTDAEELRSGDPVAVVDGVRRIAVGTPEPFFRSLQLGDRGRDVAWLHDVLAAAGVGSELGGGGEVTAATVEAIRSWSEQLGAPPSPTFDPAWIVWLPESPYRLATVDLAVGIEAPGRGTVIGASGPTLASLELISLDGGAIALAPEVSYSLSIGDVTVQLEPDGTPGAEPLAALAEVVPREGDAIEGSVARTVPERVWSVPTTAVMSGPQGQVCVWAADGTGYSPQTVQVRAARAGATFLVPLAEDPMAVLMNPAAIIDEPSCPSA